MSIKNSLKNSLPLAKIISTNPGMLKVHPSVLWYLNGYMSKFQIHQVGENLILHSHLPPLNSRAYSRFVKEHLLGRIEGPSHAQIGITNACPQNCEYCYNRNRQGHVMDTATIKHIARQLKQMGVVWLGLTGGEPLLNKDITEITESIAGDCAVKLFTTGCTLTRQQALDLKNAGLFSVSISLDHTNEKDHDRVRRYNGAFQQALKAIEIFKTIGVVSQSKTTVLIEGESGTGKELIARVIHRNTSPNEPYVAVNCSAIVETLLESELFGHEKGSFTGAISRKLGKFELARYGTVFLDEISEMSLNLQAKLLRVLQEMEFERVGGKDKVNVNARIIAATNTNLKGLVQEGKFRDDLFYRLNVVSIHIPPLRERVEDISPLVDYLLAKINLDLNKQILGVSDDVMEAFLKYNWPGN